MPPAARVELVCPAGTLPALKAAVDHGADCVHFGLRNETNARNFGGLNFDAKAAAEGVGQARTEIEVFGFGSLCVMVEGRCALSSCTTGEGPNTVGVCSLCCSTALPAARRPAIPRCARAATPCVTTPTMRSRNRRRSTRSSCCRSSSGSASPGRRHVHRVRRRLPAAGDPSRRPRHDVLRPATADRGRHRRRTAPEEPARRRRAAALAHRRVSARRPYPGLPSSRGRTSTGQ